MSVNQSHMACLQLGHKAEQFHHEDHKWFSTTGLPSDVTVLVGEMTFHLHKYPLLSRSGLLRKLIEESSVQDGSASVVQLHDIPGGAKAFKLIAKFLYDVKIDVTALNVIGVRCAAEYLRMTEDYGKGNLIAQTEDFLGAVFSNWADSMKALESCDVVLPHAEDLHLVSRCIDSLAAKACANPDPDPNKCGLRHTNMYSPISPKWNGIGTEAMEQYSARDEWWYEDVCYLNLPLYKRLIQTIEMKGVPKPEIISGSLIYYAKKYLPLMNRKRSFKETHVNLGLGTPVSTPSEADQKIILEEIVGLLPTQFGATKTKYLLRMLRNAVAMHASPSCREDLERRAGAQLDQARLEDILIPKMGHSVETLHDIDCVQRIVDSFMLAVQAAAAESTPCVVEEAGQPADGFASLNSITAVANLVDEYLAEVATDVNLKYPKFQSLAGSVPDYARPLSDGIYYAIDTYLKAHPWLTDSEKEQICKLMNSHKLTIEAATHAVQNERLPIRLIVQLVFFEQLRLRTSISGCFFVANNLENSQNPNRNLMLTENDEDTARNRAIRAMDVRERVVELEKECLGIKQDIQKLLKSKKGWSIFPKRFSFGVRSQSLPRDSKESQDSEFKK